MKYLFSFVFMLVTSLVAAQSFLDPAEWRLKPHFGESKPIVYRPLLNYHFQEKLKFTPVFFINARYDPFYRTGMFDKPRRYDEIFGFNLGNERTSFSFSTGRTDKGTISSGGLTIRW